MTEVTVVVTGMVKMVVETMMMEMMMGVRMTAVTLMVVTGGGDGVGVAEVMVVT